MLTLGTGNKRKRQAGYTLLEVMGVITIIGLMTLLVYPEFNITPERNEVVYIGKLLKTDINLVKEEAYSSKKGFLIEFNGTGYGYPIDEANIRRSFERYRFAFIIPEPEGTPGPGEPEPTPTPEPAASDQKAGTEGEMGEFKPNELYFTGDGKCNQFELSWQSMHFTGKIKVDQDGTVDWSYAKK